jgi:uncharacterized protein YciW
MFVLLWVLVVAGYASYTENPVQAKPAHDNV